MSPTLNFDVHGRNPGCPGDPRVRCGIPHPDPVRALCGGNLWGTGHALATRGSSGRQSYALSFYRVESVPHTLSWALMVVVLLTGLRCRRRRSRGLVPCCTLNPPTSRNGRLWMMTAPCGVCTPIPFSAALGTGDDRVLFFLGGVTLWWHYEFRRDGMCGYDTQCGDNAHGYANLQICTAWVCSLFVVRRAPYAVYRTPLQFRRRTHARTRAPADTLKRK